ncbi:MAG: Wzz/FepE/Etk N-terminal domain-containing protein [Geminicoccaceae bacterium]|nr:Wzz/FepE/Etk N-terminal domain-containing protein [Geminicoccaceae bacterium]
MSDRVPRELTLLELWAVLRRHRLFIATVLIVGCGLTTGLVSLLPPVYEARVLLLVEPERTRVGEPAQLGLGAFDNAFVDNQVQVLTSRSLARSIVVGLGLARDPEFLAPLPTPAQAVAALSTYLGRRAGRNASDAASEDDPAERLVDRFLERLVVAREGRTSVIAIAFKARDPNKAARIANAIAEHYQLAQLANKAEAAKRDREWLGARLAALEERHEADRAALAAFRERFLPDGSAEARRDAERIAQLERELVAASLERSAKEARLVRLRELLRKGEPLPPLDDLGSSALLQNLAALKAQALRREAELKADYGERHPKILDVRRERAELEARIEFEQASLLREQEAAIQTLKSREQALARELDRLKTRAAERERASRELEALERRVEASRRLYETYQGLVERAAQGEATQGPDARVISEAVPPDSPVFPRPKVAFTVSATVSLLVALFAVYLREVAAHGFRTAEELEVAIRCPSLALLPRLSRRAEPAPEAVVLARPSSRFTEGIRSVLAALLACRQPGVGLVVVVASALPGEGKTTLALCLGRLAAREGLKTLLIDADRRRPSVNERLGAKERPGLAAVLRGEAGLDAALAVDPESGLVVLSGNDRGPLCARLLGTEGLGRLLAAARARFDLVLLDTPPVLAVADARLVALSVDRALLVVHWRATERATIEAALARAPELAAKLLGAILNRVDLARLHRYGPSSDRRTHRALARYYAD